jgi:hypothetical protein
VPINDVKDVLQTGRFEGQQVAYKNKRTKLVEVLLPFVFFCWVNAVS